MKPRSPLRTALATVPRNRGLLKSKEWHTVGPLGDRWSSPEKELRREPDQKGGTTGRYRVFRAGNVTCCDVIPLGQSSFVAPDGRKDPHSADQLPLYTGVVCKSRRITEQDGDSHTMSKQELTC